MGDSEDEYDRKRRDKFRGERSSGDNYRSERRDERRAAGGGPPRDDWAERNPFRGGRPRPDYRDYGRPRERYGSPVRDMPPAKRMRPDWGDDMRGNPRYAPYDPYLLHAWNEHYAAHSMHSAYGHPHPMHARGEPVVNSDLQTQPAMLTLKQFLDTQDDGISDSEVLRKYSEYKLDFKRQQLNEFFVTHKDEEWFKNKYHPTESLQRKEEQQSFLKNRVAVFRELLENGSIKSVSIDTNQTDLLLRLLDTVVIKLEGGTDEDLRILDEKPKEIIHPERMTEKKTDDDDVIITSVEKKTAPNEALDEEPKVVSPRPIQRTVAASDEENWDDEEESPAKLEVKEVQKPDEKPSAKSLKRKRTSSDSTISSSSESDSSSGSSSEAEDDYKIGEKYDLVSVKSEVENDTNNTLVEETIGNNNLLSENVVNGDKSDEVKDDGAEAVPIIKKEMDKIKLDGDSKDAENIKLNENEADKITNASVEAEESTNPSLEKMNRNDDHGKEEDVDKPETIDLDKEKDVIQPRALHRTSSIFLRNLAPSITKSEIESLCKGFNGYLRVAIADPLVERRWYRRGWVTFKRDVNIKEICWNLNNTRLRDCEMGAIVNRDLSRRVRPVNGMTAHKIIVRADIKLCAKVAMNLDEKFKLWQRQGDAGNEEQEKSNGDAESANNSYGFKSNNPVLQNITDFLIEEASAEEEELLGITGESKEVDGDGIERDAQLITVLDCLILYLRIVHSVDFYNHCEYPYEDEMPNRCGIIHARGPMPSKVIQNDLQDYIKNFEGKMQTFLAKTATIEDDELVNLGAKNSESEVEKFIQANTQELAKDKWLCPLSGKKFKGPEFIRKHIFNKHLEKVEEVRKEVEYFNNYLKDPKRPQLPEHPGVTKRTSSESSGGGGFRQPMYQPAYGAPYTAYAPPMMMPGRGVRGFGGGPRRHANEYRQLIQYRDLDAPQDPVDIFN